MRKEINGRMNVCAFLSFWLLLTCEQALVEDGTKREGR